MKSTKHKVSDYIQKCAERGISSLEDIHKNLKKEISDVEDELLKVEPLRARRRELQKISDHISSLMQTDKITSSFDDESEELVQMQLKIVKLIEEQGALDNREIIMKAGYNKDAYIVRAIKLLAEKEVLEKNSETKKISTSSKWSDRYKILGTSV